MWYDYLNALNKQKRTNQQPKVTGIKKEDMGALNKPVNSVN